MSAAGKDDARGESGASTNDSSNDCSEREWVSLGEGFSLEITREAPDLIEVIWHPRMPDANEMPLVFDAYLRARDRYLAGMVARSGKKVYDIALIGPQRGSLQNRAQRRAAAARQRSKK
jgi:hypothetical protein